MYKVFILSPKCSISWLENAVEVDNIDDANTILFTGGTDVNPELYGEKRGSYTDTPDTKRDMLEASIWNKYKDSKKFIGICRGAQFLSVMNGCKLIQHIPNRNDGTIRTTTNEFYNIPSSHHQCLDIASRPSNLDIVLYAREHNALNFTVPEVFTIGSNCFCIQGHPEWNANKSTLTYLNSLINNFFTNEK